MSRHKTMVMTIVQLEGSDDAAVVVTLNVPCELHDGHKMQDEWRVPDMVGHGNDFDWIRDVMVSVVERY